MLATIGCLVGHVVTYLLDIPVWGLFVGLAILASGRMSQGYGWANGWDARGRQAAEQVRDRVVGVMMAGEPAGMIAFYAAVEAEHVGAGHSGEAGACSPCNTAASEWIRRRWQEKAAR